MHSSMLTLNILSNLQANDHLTGALTVNGGIGSGKNIISNEDIVGQNVISKNNITVANDLYVNNNIFVGNMFLFKENVIKFKKTITMDKGTIGLPTDRVIIYSSQLHSINHKSVNVITQNLTTDKSVNLSNSLIIQQDGIMISSDIILHNDQNVIMKVEKDKERLTVNNLKVREFFINTVTEFEFSYDARLDPESSIIMINSQIDNGILVMEPSNLPNGVTVLLYVKNKSIALHIDTNEGVKIINLNKGGKIKLLYWNHNMYVI